jgi:hypothetical protein
MTPFGRDILWTAQRHGQDWRDEEVLSAVEWLEGLVPSTTWRARADATAAYFEHAKERWSQGDRVPLFDPSDAIAWYMHQSRCYADPLIRPNYFMPEGYRIAPLLKRIGQLLPDIQAIDGGEERAARLMSTNLSQPDDGFYELLVGGACRRRGWDDVSFVPEAPGVGQRPDLLVKRRRACWAVECKRAGRSGYARDERLAGELMAQRVHTLSKAAKRPLIILAQFSAELHLLGEDYLVAKVERFLNGDHPFEWEDDGGVGIVFDVDWRSLHRVMEKDDVYFGSSRMFELLVGGYDTSVDFSMKGDWTPAEGRPLHATWVHHVSLVSWRSRSDEAARRKSMHFRGLVARAARQLPGDCPGIVHVGYEAVGGNSADGRRHALNRQEMRRFDPEKTKLRTVYGNYFTNELVTARNESAAVNETTAWYSVGRGGGKGPEPAHLLFTDEDGQPGSHLK